MVLMFNDMNPPTRSGGDTMGMRRPAARDERNGQRLREAEGRTAGVAAGGARIPSARPRFASHRSEFPHEFN